MSSTKASAMVKGVTALAVALGALVPAVALAKIETKRRPPAIALSLDRSGIFTPADADPRLAAAFAGRAPLASDFKFTPAAAKGRPAQLRVAVRARSTAPAASAQPTLTPLAVSSYNLGVAVGWRRFAVTTDVAETRSTDPAVGDHQSALVGVNYSIKRFTGRVAVAADRNEGQISAIARPDSYSVDVGGAYSLTNKLAVTGGVRYKIEQDRLKALRDDRADSKAVYVGTAFKF